MPPLVQSGWFVGISDHDAVELEKLQDFLGAEQSMAFTLDVTSKEQWTTALADFFDKTGRLDVLLNNAGVLSSGEFQNIDSEKQQLMIDVNVKGVINGCHAAFDYLKATTNSKVINLSSAASIYGQPSLATYSASKFAVRGLTEALNLEWEAYDIHVLSIMPLFVKTDMVSNMDAKSIDLLGVQLSADDVADTILKTASTKGNTLPVHHPVGFKAKCMALLADLSPSFVNRKVNKVLGVRKKTSH